MKETNVKKDEIYSNALSLIKAELEKGKMLSPYSVETVSDFSILAVKIGKAVKDLRTQSGWSFELIRSLAEDLGDVSPYDLLNYCNFFSGIESFAKTLSPLKKVAKKELAEASV